MKRYKLLFTKKAALAIIFITLAAHVFSQSNFSLSEVNDFDRMVMNPYSKSLDYLGSGFEALTLLTPAVLFAASSQDYWKIGVEYVETIALAYGVKELAKLCVSRPRPYMYFDNAHKIKLMNGIVNYQSVILARYIKNAKILLSVKLVFRIIIAITVFGRLISGVHWTTDIAGGILLSWSLIEFYKKFYGII